MFVTTAKKIKTITVVVHLKGASFSLCLSSWSLISSLINKPSWSPPIERVTSMGSAGPDVVVPVELQIGRHSEELRA